VTGAARHAIIVVSAAATCMRREVSWRPATLPPADLAGAARVATAVAALAPLDPFSANPTEGGFEAAAGPGGAIQAVWSGDRFQYEVDFTTDGAIDNVTRQDGRIKPF
jgi:hypothetical protein